MAIYRSGTFTVADKTAVQTLNLGFVPDLLILEDITLLLTTGDGITATWDQAMNAIAGGPITKLIDVAGGTLTQSTLTTTGVLSFQTSDAALFVPAQAPYTTTTGDRAYIRQSTNQVIATAGNITNAANAVVTTGEAHSFTASDIGVTVVTFHGVPGMTQINGVSGTILSVPTTTTFSVSINTSNFSAYSSVGVTQGVNSGFFNVITGAPVDTLYSNTLLPTAEANLGIIGVTIGTGVVGATGASNADIWSYHAWLQSPVTGP